MSVSDVVSKIKSNIFGILWSKKIILYTDTKNNNFQDDLSGISAQTKSLVSASGSWLKNMRVFPQGPAHWDAKLQTILTGIYQDRFRTVTLKQVRKGVAWNVRWSTWKVTSRSTQVFTMMTLIRSLFFKWRAPPSTLCTKPEMYSGHNLKPVDRTTRKPRTLLWEVGNLWFLNI